MKIEHIQVASFRNLGDVSVVPHAKVNLLIGANAQGKTNFLEAMAVAATGSSFRGSRDRDMVRDGQQGYRVVITHRIAERRIETELSWSLQRGKELRIGGKRANFGHPDRLRAVVFTPEDLQLIKGAPEKRRAFMDVLLSQISADYRRHHRALTALLQRRQLMVRGHAQDRRGIEVLEDMLIETMVPVTMDRISLAARLEEEMNALYDRLSGEKQVVRVRYALSYPLSAGRLGPELLAASLAAELRRRRRQGDWSAVGKVGPHREDLHVYLDTRNARTHASQGQQRNLAVCLKLSEMQTVKAASGHHAVFLLDEVLAELDRERRQRLVDHLQEAPFQSFISAVEIPGLLSSRESKVLTVRGGAVTEEE
ncbi:MAG: DNA replication and repair protein RecF [Syntrophomonadaceae bacterium]|nr:DNA replication and repair protein RecF [Syntrophomonadaceae bacterium]